MPYVVRDDDHRILRIEPKATSDAVEQVPEDDPELRAFMEEATSAARLHEILASTDLEMIRVIEDLITVLIDKRIIMLTDLPLAAQAKLAKRYQLRSQLNDLGGIVAEAEEIMLP